MPIAFSMKARSLSPRNCDPANAPTSTGPLGINARGSNSEKSTCNCSTISQSVCSGGCWRDSAHANKQRLLTLPVDEFLRRFLLHLLPRGFVRIRNFGFLANRRRAALLPLCFQLLAVSADIPARTASPAADHPCSSTYWNCEQ